MEITKREIIFSVIIVSVMIGLGIFIHTKIDNKVRDENAMYNKAVELESNEMFKYGLETNVGDSFTYGKLKTVDPVTMDGYGPYMLIERELEEYRKHTRTKKDSDGKEYTETYWTWDHIKTDKVHSTTVNFCEVDFSYSDFPVPTQLKRQFKIDVPCGYHRRYQYYGLSTDFEGTLFADLDEHTINNARFLNKVTLDNAVESFSSSPTVALVVFWIFWVIIIVGLVIGFYYIDNKWLEG